MISWSCVFGCTQRECKPNETIIGQHAKMFESRISAGATENLPGWQKPQAQTVAWSYDMEGHAQKMRWVILRIGEQKDRAFFQSLHTLFGWSQLQEGRHGSVGELSNVCSQMALKFLYLAIIGRLDLLWSVNKFPRGVTKVNESLWQTLSSFDFTHSHEWPQTILPCGQYGAALSIGLFRDSDFSRDLEDSKSTSGRLLRVFGGRTFVSTSWMCKKQSSVSHRVQQNLKLFCWMLVFAWTEYPRLIFGTWL